MDREKVGNGLEGVEILRQGVDDRHAGVLSEIGNVRVRPDTGDHAGSH